MDLSIQALVMGIVQGLTEFLPISSSGHLVLVPWLFGWKDPFIDSVAFTVILHMGTLLALLVYFWRDWLTLIPAGLAAIRDRSFKADPNRKMAFLLVIATIPAVLVGPIFESKFEELVREPARIAVMLCVGAAILWLADRWGARQREMDSLTFRESLGIGIAQVLALVPGISRSGISISAGLFMGLNREAAARFSFLMATPVIGGAGVWEARKFLTHEAGPSPEANVILIGFVAAAISGILAVHFMLEFLRRRPVTVFVVYRVVAAAFVFVVLLSPHGA
ncbi:MAG TPA: undecaprenyl-diphosphatase UppP [Candidatus Limnocylindrales bacterium]